jgi:hypothetical protein
VPNQDVFAQHYVDFQKVVVQIPHSSALCCRQIFIRAFTQCWCSISFFFFSNENFSQKIAWELVGSTHVGRRAESFD